MMKMISKPEGISKMMKSMQGLMGGGGAGGGGPLFGGGQQGGTGGGQYNPQKLLPAVRPQKLGGFEWLTAKLGKARFERLHGKRQGVAQRAQHQAFKAKRQLRQAEGVQALSDAALGAEHHQ